MILTVQQGLRQYWWKKKEEIDLKVDLENLGEIFGLKFSKSFVRLPLEAEGGSLSPILSISIIFIALTLQMQRPCPAVAPAYPVQP